MLFRTLTFNVNVYREKRSLSPVARVPISSENKKLKDIKKLRLHIFTLPVFFYYDEHRTILTSIFPWSCCRDVWAGCSEYHPVVTEDPRVNFEKRFEHYEIYTWTLCYSYLHEKQTSRIQSLKRMWIVHFSFKFLFRTFDTIAFSCIISNNMILIPVVLQM